MERGFLPVPLPLPSFVPSFAIDSPGGKEL